VTRDKLTAFEDAREKAMRVCEASFGEDPEHDRQFDNISKRHDDVLYTHEPELRAEYLAAVRRGLIRPVVMVLIDEPATVAVANGCSLAAAKRVIAESNAQGKHRYSYSACTHEPRGRAAGRTLSRGVG
jgi:hypothetical protein